MTDLNIIRPRKDILLAGSGNPTVATTARVGDRYQNTDAPYEMFTCVSKQDFGWGDVHGWVGTQGTIVDPDILDPNNDNLVAGYTMDSVTGATLNDMSVNGNNGTINVATQTPGIIGNALRFQQGTSPSVQCAYNTTPKMAVSMFARRTSTTHRNPLMVDTGGYFALSFGRTTGSPDGVISFSSFTTDAGWLDGPTVAEDTWVHILAQYGDVYELWVDGTLAASGTPRGIGSNLNFNLGFWGGATQVLDRYLDGDIDQVRIFDRNLVQAEATTLSNERNVT